MLTQGFYYFLIIGELAILGLIIAGICLKVRRIMSMSVKGRDVKNSEHDVSKSDHLTGAESSDFLDRPPALPPNSEKMSSEDTHRSLHS